MGRHDWLYVGASLVLSGDVHQLRPVRCGKDRILYERVNNGLFEGNINTATTLEVSHCFEKDSEYGALLMYL